MTTVPTHIEVDTNIESGVFTIRKNEHALEIDLINKDISYNEMLHEDRPANKSITNSLYHPLDKPLSIKASRKPTAAYIKISWGDDCTTIALPREQINDAIKVVTKFKDFSRVIRAKTLQQNTL